MDAMLGLDFKALKRMGVRQVNVLTTMLMGVSLNSARWFTL